MFCDVLQREARLALKAGSAAQLEDQAAPSSRCRDCPLLCEKEVAPILRVSVSWLQKARVRGTGPHFVKIGRKVLYPLCAVQAFRTANLFESTSEFGAEGGSYVR